MRNPPGNPGGHWYVVQTQPRKERLALAHLERQGFTCFLPEVNRPTSALKTSSLAVSALFPGYLFAAFNPDLDRWRSINGTIGVLKLVAFGELPAPLPEGFVEALMGRLSEAADPALETELPAGARIRIVGGIFDDLTGTLLSRQSRERVFVLLNLLSGPRRINLSRHQLIEA